MFRINRTTLPGLAVILALLLSLATPMAALADDGTPTPEPTLTETPPAETPAPTEDPAAAPTEVPAETLEALEQAEQQQVEVVLLNEDGAVVTLDDPAAAEILAYPDPYIIRGGITYAFTAADCDPVTDGAQPCSNPIQKAIDFALPGEEVVVEAGTYTEQLVITKNLVLRAAGTVILQSPDLLAVNYSNNKSIIYVEGADVTIDGFIIDGLRKGNANYRFSGILYRNAGGVISNNLIRNITDNPQGGNQHGNGIIVRNEDSAARSVEIRNNILHDIQKNGISVSGNNLNATIDGNTVIGLGPTGTIAGNGIQVSGGAGGVVSYNIITGYDYIPAPPPATQWVSTGLLIYDAADGIQILNNLVGASDVNIYLYLVDNAVVRGNQVAGGEYGIGVYQSNNASITFNDIRDASLTGVEVWNSSGVKVNYNNIYGNAEGITNWDEGNLVDALNNWWGCAGGPGAEGCDSAYDANLDLRDSKDTPEFNIIYEPFWVANLDPDKDGIFTPEDNCPDVANPDQADSDQNGVGDACQAPVVEPGDDGGTTVLPPLPGGGGAAVGLIPVTAGQLAALSCVNSTTLQLASGDRVRFNGVLCDYRASLTPEAKEALPAVLPVAREMISAETVTLLNPVGEKVERLPAEATMTLSFRLPKEQFDGKFAVYYWDQTLNKGAGDWAQLPEKKVENGAVKQEYLRDGDERLITSGVELMVVSAGEQRVEFTANFTGTFVLVPLP